MWPHDRGGVVTVAGLQRRHSGGSVTTRRARQEGGYTAKSVCLFVWLPACVSAGLPVCLPVYLPACLPVCLPTCLSVCLSACLPACLLACLSDACLPICLSVCPTPGMIKNSERYSFFTVVWSSGEGWLLTVTGLTGPDEQPVDLMTLSLCCKSRHDLTTAQPGTGRVTWSSGPRQKMPLHPRDTTTNTWISLC